MRPAASGWPDANVGVRTGERAVLDMDGKI
jgi:hypothetical protein